MFASGAFSRVDTDLLGCHDEQDDDPADGISWSETQSSSHSAGAAPLHVSVPSNNLPALHEEDAGVRAIEEASPEFVPAHLSHRKAGNVPEVSREPGHDIKSISKPDKNPSGSKRVSHFPNWSSAVEEGRSFAQRHSRAKIFSSSRRGSSRNRPVPTTSEPPRRHSNIPSAVGQLAPSCSTSGSRAAQADVSSVLEEIPSPAADPVPSRPPGANLSPVLGAPLSPVLGHVSSPVLGPSRSPVLGPLRRFSVAPLTAASGEKRPSSVLCAGGEAMPRGAPRSQQSSQASELSPVIERRPRVPRRRAARSVKHPAAAERRQKPNSPERSAVGDEATPKSGLSRPRSAEYHPQTHPPHMPQSIHPPQQPAEHRIETTAGVIAEEEAEIPAESRRTASERLVLRQSAARRLFPSEESHEKSGFCHRESGPANAAPETRPSSDFVNERRQSFGHEGTKETGRPTGSGTRPEVSGVGVGTLPDIGAAETSMEAGAASRADRPDISPALSPGVHPGAERRRRPPKRPRTRPDVCAELRGGRNAAAVPTVSSQERHRWLRRVTAAAAAPAAAALAAERSASDWVREIRRAERTPEKPAEEPAAPLSASKQPKRRGLVQRLRRLLKRNEAFARMGRHRSDANADQSSLSVVAVRCERQLGGVMVQAAGPAGSAPVYLLLASGAGHPAVSAGDRVTLRPPWQRLTVGEQDHTVLLPAGGVSVEPGPAPSPAPPRVYTFTCPCPDGSRFSRRCVRPLPAVSRPSPPAAPSQSRLVTVRAARPDDTTVLAALGAGGDIVTPIDATVRRVCRYRCPADSQTSEGVEEEWCWSLLVTDAAGTTAELVVPAPVVRQTRRLLSAGRRLRLTGLVVRERTTSDRCPALASMVVALSGVDPGFTYVLQALPGESVISPASDELSPPPPGPGESVISPAPGELSPPLPGPGQAAEPPGGPAGDPGRTDRHQRPSEEADRAPRGDRTISEPCATSDGEALPATPTQPRHSPDNIRDGVTSVPPADPTSAPAMTSGGDPAVGRRVALACRLLAQPPGCLLVLTSGGGGAPLRLRQDGDAALLLAPGQTAVIRDIWRRDGEMTVDRYSTVERRDDIVISRPAGPLPPLSVITEPLRLIMLTGEVVGVDEQCASIWPACSTCGSDDLTETSTGQFCNYCCLDALSVVTRMELKVDVSCPCVSCCRVSVQLLQGTIETLLGRTSGDPEQGYELSSVLGQRLSQLACIVTSRQHNSISLHEVRL